MIVPTRRGLYRPRRHEIVSVPGYFCFHRIAQLIRGFYISCSYSIVLVGLNILLRSTVSVLRTEPVVSIREVIRAYIDRDIRIVRQVRYTLKRCVKRVSEVSTGERCLCTRPETRRATLVPSGRRGVASPVSLSFTPFFSRADSPSRLLSTLYNSISRSVREK